MEPEELSRGIGITDLALLQHDDLVGSQAEPDLRRSQVGNLCRCQRRKITRFERSHLICGLNWRYLEILDDVRYTKKGPGASKGEG